LLQLIGVDTEIRPWDIVGDLSIGKQQIVEIAKALSGNPAILILDEPTASLSNAEIERLFAVIKTLRSQGISMIYITHYLRDIFKICDSITVIRDGRIVFRRNTDQIEINELIDSITGTETQLISWNRRQNKRSGTPLLEIKNLYTKAVENISLCVYPGEIVGIAGILGSGRTELFRALFGIDALSSGEILIDGKKTTIASPADAIDRRISLIPENRREQGLVLDFPVRENMVLSIYDRLRKFFLIDDKKTAELAARYIKALGVKTSGPMQIVRYLSGGNQQKVVVAKSLASNSRILLLDDPTFGVDIHAKREIMNIIHDFAGQGNGVIMVSSEFNELVDFCDSIYVMKKGRISDFISGQTSEDELLLKVM
jgi:ribose transport system ATP-binding protein